MVRQGIEEIWSLFLWAEEGSQIFFCECNAYYLFITEFFQGSREKNLISEIHTTILQK